MLSGLPRTGSTLLSAILNQNPKIHSEGSSHLCELMFSVQQSCINDEQRHLRASRRFPKTMHNIVSALPGLYYKDIKKPIIVDKCRVWANHANMQLIYNYITDKPKVIILRRKVEEIMMSLLNIFKKNNINFTAYDILSPTNDDFRIPILSVIDSYKNNNGTFLFVNYNDIVENTERTLKDIYDFCEWEYYPHNFTNIVHPFPEDDTYYGLQGLHDVNPTIIKENKNIELSKDILNFCHDINKLIGV